MKHWTFLALFGFLAISPVALAQQVPGNRGFDTLVCVAERAESLPGNAQVDVEINDPGVEPGGVGVAEVTICHGTKCSTHDVEYEDTNLTGFLDCGDTILGVT